MPQQMVWDSTLGKMVKVEKVKSRKNVEKISIKAEQYAKLKQYSQEDGFDFTGVSYVTEKDAKGNTKKDANGKPIFVYVTENGKKIKKTITVPVSVAKVNSAIMQYVEVAIDAFIAKRDSKSVNTETK